MEPERPKKAKNKQMITAEHAKKIANDYYSDVALNYSSIEKKIKAAAARGEYFITIDIISHPHNKRNRVLQVAKQRFEPLGFNVKLENISSQRDAYESSKIRIDWSGYFRD